MTIFVFQKDFCGPEVQCAASLALRTSLVVGSGHKEQRLQVRAGTPGDVPLSVTVAKKTTAFSRPVNGATK